jgi:hypothetical protein
MIHQETGTNFHGERVIPFNEPTPDFCYAPMFD